jgi:septal ring factor EnvC (AmiA/AmiB activator)
MVLQAQRDTMQDALKGHAQESKAVSAAAATQAGRAKLLNTQLAARDEELQALQSQLAVVESEVHDWRAQGAQFATQLEAAERANQAQAHKLTVLATQARMREEDADALKAQLAMLEAAQCAPPCRRT